MTESATIEVRYMSYEEASRYSGLSVNTLRRLIRSGRLPASRPVDRVLIDRQVLDNFMTAASAQSASE